MHLPFLTMSRSTGSIPRSTICEKVTRVSLPIYSNFHLWHMPNLCDCVSRVTSRRSAEESRSLPLSNDAATRLIDAMIHASTKIKILTAVCHAQQTITCSSSNSLSRRIFRTKVMLKSLQFMRSFIPKQMSESIRLRITTRRSVWESRSIASLSTQNFVPWPWLKSKFCVTPEHAT